MAQDTPSRKLDQYIVRFPDGMRDRLKGEAAKNGRSMNAEIIARLDESFSSERKYTEQDILRIMDALEEATKKVRENTQAQESFLKALFAGQNNMADTLLGRPSPKKPKP